MPADYTIDGYLCAADATIDQVHPRKDILLVRRIPDEEITASGVAVPDSARNPAMGVRVGEVLKCGPGDMLEFNDLFDIPLKADVNHATGTVTDKIVDGKVVHVRCNVRASMECKPGDRILYMRCPDNDVNIGGVDCVLLREEQHVLAIL